MSRNAASNSCSLPALAFILAIITIAIGFLLLSEIARRRGAAGVPAPFVSAALPFCKPRAIVIRHGRGVAAITEGPGMLGFDLTDEQQQLRALARRFAEQEIIPRARQYDEEAIFPRDICEKAF